MQNPFESGHIKNYLLLYASIVVIMVLFFIASTLFHDIKKFDKKSFDTNVSKVSDENISADEVKNSVDKNSTSMFKLMQKSY